MPASRLLTAEPIRDVIVGQVRKLVGGDGTDAVERARRDVGWFGPGSAC